MSKTTIILLAVLVLVMAFILAQGIFDINPIALGKYFLAQVGVTVGVKPNPFNTLAQQLDKKEEDLKAKEQLLEKRILEENNLGDQTLQYLLFIGGGLLALVVLNFYLDYRRKR